jgi:mannose-6-phosphate isomerase-like protein (cupin superfamily)
VITTDDDIDAGLLALGCLAAGEHAAARQRQAHDPAFAKAALDWEARLLPLALALPPVEPPPGLLAEIERRISRNASAPARSTIRADEGKWRSVSPGISSKLLHRMLSIGRQTILLKVEPGAVYDGHDHDEDEELYMISGDLTIGGIELGPGDFHLAPKGSRHPRATTRNGCMCLFVMAL